MSTVLDYRYLAPSALMPEGTASRLALATSGGTSPAGEEAHPYFFSAFVEYPSVVATALLAVARVARTRFYVPPNTLAAILRAADPVVTSTPQGLRFESFSACCGVYARLDVAREALDIHHCAPGVTNVDVNPPLRQALAGVQSQDQLLLGVGDEALQVSTGSARLIEEKVPLPSRWLKGFAETQYACAGMRLHHALDLAATRAFLQGLPRQSATKTVMWAVPALRSLRLASQPAAGAVCVAGPERLRVLEPLLRFATGLRAYGPEVVAGSLPVASAWVLDLPGVRFTVALSPEKSRGFSGEGGVLHGLAGDTVAEDADLIATLLSFEPRIDIPRLALASALTVARVGDALGVLASSGQVGFDLADSAYFHRPMPLARGALADMHPRLADAHRLVDAGAVLPGVGPGTYRVHSADLHYEVRLQEGDASDRCTCPWFAKYRDTRGPCKHVLAARIFSRGEPE